MERATHVLTSFLLFFLPLFLLLLLDAYGMASFYVMHINSFKRERGV